MTRRLNRWYTRHQAFFLILLLFVSFRFLALLLLRPGGFIADNSDYEFYYAWGQLSAMGYRPFVDTWSTYPPLFPALLLPAFELASRLPPWEDPRLFFHTIFGLELLLFDVGNLILLYRLAQKLEADQATDFIPSSCHPVILYALLFTPLYTLLGFFEVMPLFFLLLGMDLLSSGKRWQWFASAIVIGLGFLTKLTPIVLIPAALRYIAQRSGRQMSLRNCVFYSALVLITIVGVGYPLVYGNLELGVSSLRIQTIRPPWQSVWALIDGYYGFGLVPIDMRNLVGLRTYRWQTQIPWTLVTALFGLAFLWLYTRRFDWAKLRTLYGFTALSVIGLLLYSKGWSPQFLVWVLVFVVLMLPTLRGMLMALLLSLINFVEAFVYFVLLPDQAWILVATVIARTVLLLLLAVEFLSQLWSNQQVGLPLRRIARTGSWLGLSATVIVAGLLTPRGVDAYWARRLAAHPCPVTLERLQSEAGWPNRLIITDQVETWQWFYPWLRNEYEVRLLDGYNSEDRPPEVVEIERLAELPQTELWLLLASADLPAWQERLKLLSPTAKATKVFEVFQEPAADDQPLSPCTLLRLFHDNKEAHAGTVMTPGSPIYLVNSQFNVDANRTVRVVLYWYSDASVPESYTVFTQLFDPNGRMVAQQDNLPVRGLAPTNTWAAATFIRDPYELPLPDDAPPGTYQLLVGMYDTSLQRQPIRLLDGTEIDQFTFQVEVE